MRFQSPRRASRAEMDHRRSAGRHGGCGADRGSRPGPGHELGTDSAIERPEPARSVPPQPAWPRGWCRRPGRPRHGLDPRVASRPRGAARAARPRVSRRPRRRAVRSADARRRQLVSQIQARARAHGPGRRGHARRAPHSPRPAHHAHAHRRTHADSDPGGHPRRGARASLVQPRRRRPAAAHARHDAGADRALLAPEPAAVQPPNRPGRPGSPAPCWGTSSSTRTPSARTSASPSPPPRSPPGATLATGTSSA